MNFETARQLDRTQHGSSDDPSLLDFSANTNPVIPTGVEAVFRESFQDARSYPAEPSTAFRETAAEYVGCAPEQVIPTPGGLAAIRLTIALTVEDGDSVLVPAPSFGEYAREATLHGGEPTFVSQNEILDADPSGHSLAIVCNPNNPTGNAYPPATLHRFAKRCRASGTVLLVDEAFLGFTEYPSLAGTEGTVVARSLTKLFGLPGLRAGFAVATGHLQRALSGARRTWNVSVPALKTAIHSMRDTQFVEETRCRVARERSRLRAALAEQFDVYESDSPFLLFDVGERSVDSLVEGAREQGVVLRDARTFRGLDNHVRVAIRLPEENDRLCEVLDRV